MNSREVEQVLANWIAQAANPPGQLAPDTDPTRWIAQRFINWWQPQVADEVASAEAALSNIRRELDKLGGWSNPQLGEALHELINLGDALASLRSMFSLGKKEA